MEVDRQTFSWLGSGDKGEHASACCPDESGGTECLESHLSLVANQVEELDRAGSCGLREEAHIDRCPVLWSHTERERGGELFQEVVGVGVRCCDQQVPRYTMEVGGQGDIDGFTRVLEAIGHVVRLRAQHCPMCLRRVGDSPPRDGGPSVISGVARNGSDCAPPPSLAEVALSARDGVCVTQWYSGAPNGDGVWACAETRQPSMCMLH